MACSQQLNSELASLNDQLEAVREQQRANDAAIEQASAPIRDEYERRWELHRWRLAAYKLGVLTPLLLVCCWLFLQHGGGTYAMLVYALGAAVAMRVILVMHEHFPAIYFKYILILLSLGIAIGVLLRLLRLRARPTRQWLLNQYREAYASFLCPICDFPIHRGPLRYAFWTRRSLKKYSLKAAAIETTTAERPYSCPCCGTSLFATCEKCDSIRHTLLPACESCGAQQSSALPAT